MKLESRLFSFAVAVQRLTFQDVARLAYEADIIVLGRAREFEDACTLARRLCEQNEPPIGLYPFDMAPGSPLSDVEARASGPDAGRAARRVVVATALAVASEDQLDQDSFITLTLPWQRACPHLPLPKNL